VVNLQNVLYPVNELMQLSALTPLTVQTDDDLYQHETDMAKISVVWNTVFVARQQHNGACSVVTIYPLSNSEALSLWKAMSASGNIAASVDLQDSDVLPMFLTISIRSIHGSVRATWQYVVTSAHSKKSTKYTSFLQESSSQCLW